MRQLDPSFKSADPTKHIEILYPSEASVRDSILGVEAAVSLRLNNSHWTFKEFPQRSFCHLRPRLPLFDRMLYHSKVFIANPNDQYSISDGSLLYFGSHNFSPSAWGNDEKGES